MTATTIQPTAPDRRVAVDGVSWDVYRQLCNEIVHGATRITYDQGRMEIVVVSNRHERIKTMLGRLLEAYGDATGVIVEGLGNTTFARKDLKMALEPDECYWVANAGAVVGRQDELDPLIDPPPDLAIEVELSRAAVRRQPIYAAMGVPELWHYDGATLTFLHLTPTGIYIRADTSLAFPGLVPQLLNELLAIGLAQGQSAAAAELRRRISA
jgi:Uma2 family endonuclease